jgi:hypothetical protein
MQVRIAILIGLIISLVGTNSSFGIIIEGKIIACYDTSGLVGAKVTIDNKFVYTDINGFFTIHLTSVNVPSLSISYPDLVTMRIDSIFFANDTLIDLGAIPLFMNRVYSVDFYNSLILEPQKQKKCRLIQDYGGPIGCYKIDELDSCFFTMSNKNKSMAVKYNYDKNINVIILNFKDIIN